MVIKLLLQATCNLPHCSFHLLFPVLLNLTGIRGCWCQRDQTAPHPMHCVLENFVRMFLLPQYLLLLIHFMFKLPALPFQDWEGQGSNAHMLTFAHSATLSDPLFLVFVYKWNCKKKHLVYKKNNCVALFKLIRLSVLGEKFRRYKNTVI